MSGIIYLIESNRDYDTVYKIGYTRRSSNKRTRQLQTGNDGSLKVVDQFHTVHGQSVERTLHNFFSHKRIKNEWFKLDLNDVVNFQKMCQKIEDNLTFLKDQNL